DRTLGDTTTTLEPQATVTHRVDLDDAQHRSEALIAVVCLGGPGEELRTDPDVGVGSASQLQCEGGLGELLRPFGLVGELELLRAGTQTTGREESTAEIGRCHLYQATITAALCLECERCHGEGRDCEYECGAHHLNLLADSMNVLSTVTSAAVTGARHVPNTYLVH